MGFWSRRNPAPSLQHAHHDRWLVVWGEVDDLTTIWRDRHFAIVSATAWVISQQQRFVVVGDLWLSNRRELVSQFALDSCLGDLELVAQLWEEIGDQAIDFLQGMFGLIVFDRHTQQLLVMRDAVGARTVYFTTGTTSWIAPQLRTLRSLHSANIDPIALRDYLTCAFVPGERTMWQGVRELRPGSVLALPSGKISSFWQLQEQIIQQESLAWHGDRLRLLLEKVVSEYLPAQQPVGVFLSGGLDSSAVTSLAAQLHDATVHTYSIHFGAETANELEFSELMAAHCQTEHHILEITWQQMWECLPETMAELDDPIGDPLTVPNLLISKLASQHVQVTLNGEGGDPCFGGPKNQPMLINSLYGNVVAQDPLQAYLTSFQKCANDLSQLIKPEIWAMMQEPSIFTADLNSDMSYLNRLMAMNIKFKGADQILTKVNNLTQAAGLQGRSPLFDQRVVEMSMTMPPEYKLSGVQEKAVLKQAVADLLPATIINRPKSGMMVPVQLGFRKYWRRSAQAILLSRHALIADYINQDVIKEWLSFRGDVWGRYGVKLWLLVSLEIWLQVNRPAQFKKVW